MDVKWNKNNDISPLGHWISLSQTIWDLLKKTTPKAQEIVQWGRSLPWMQPTKVLFYPWHPIPEPTSSDPCKKVKKKSILVGLFGKWSWKRRDNRITLQDRNEKIKSTWWQGREVQEMKVGCPWGDNLVGGPEEILACGNYLWWERAMTNYFWKIFALLIVSFFLFPHSPYPSP